MSKSQKKQSKELILPCILAFLLLVELIILLILCANFSKIRKFNEQISLGDQYYREMDYENAELHYIAAIKINKKEVVPYINLSQVYIDTEHFEEAMDILETAKKYVKRKDQIHITKQEDILEEIHPFKDYISSTKTSDSNNIIQNDDIFVSYIKETLLMQYETFEFVQGGREYSIDDKWLKHTGIMSTVIYDLDQDNASELLVCNSENDGIYLSVYENLDGIVQLADRLKFSQYECNDSGIISQSQDKPLFLSTKIVQTDICAYIVCEEESLGSFYSVEHISEIWGLTYSDGHLQYDFSFGKSGGGSSSGTYDGIEFENGIKISSQLYYSDYEEDINKALYNNYNVALQEYLKKYDLHYKTDSSGLNTRLADNNNLINVFEFRVEIRNDSIETETGIFSATLSSSEQFTNLLF